MASRLIPKTVICFLLVLSLMASLNFGQEPAPTNVAGGRGGSSFSDTQIPSGARVLEVNVFAGESPESTGDTERVSTLLRFVQTSAPLRHLAAAAAPGTIRSTFLQEAWG